jgi:dTDP-4-dehydrorhamnose 3,5-epimerase
MNLPRIERTGLNGVMVIVPVRHGDERGFFSETYSRHAFRELGIDNDFIQDNHSLSRVAGTVRGLHFQIPPFAICDVAVDIRRASPTYGRSFSATLSAENGAQLFIPEGFAHGYCTLEPDTEVFYKVDAPYSREHERGLRWNDPALAIDWPVSEAEATVLERDRLQPTLDALPVFFE